MLDRQKRQIPIIDLSWNLELKKRNKLLSIVQLNIQNKS